MEKIKNGFSDKVILGLKNVANELEEFQLQFALGKANLNDKFDELKKKFNVVIQEAKNKLSNKDIQTIDLRIKLEEIQHLLTKSNEETKEAFILQKEALIEAIEGIEKELKLDFYDKEYHLFFSTEMEKIKIKMEILNLQFEYGKLISKKEFETIKEQFLNKIDDLKFKFRESESSFEQYWNNFRKEMGVAYKHLKKAFV